jgi:acyl carrier protein
MTLFGHLLAEKGFIARNKVARRKTMSVIAARVKEIIAEVLGISMDLITLDARWREDLEADSLDLVELIMAFEDEFGGEISDEDALQMYTVGDVVDYIENWLSSRMTQSS